MTAPDQFRWDGPFAAISIRLPSGRVLAVKRGDVIDALPSEVAALSKQPGWSCVQPPKPEDKSGKTKADKPDDSPKGS